jgi:TolA-binding protein
MIGPSRDDHSYRRGLVFGWSLAEIFLLIVFALLFAFAAKVGKTQSQASAPQSSEPAFTLPVHPLPSRTPGHPPNDFDDLFRKLTLCEKRDTKCEGESNNLKQQIEQLKKEIEELKKENQQLRQENEALKRQVEPHPGGADYPSCFKNPAGKPDYIFDVMLTSGGIVIHKNDLPDQVEKEALLPLSQITFDRDIPDADFLDQTDGIFDFSNQHGCRFYVRVTHQTKADEKDTYKERLTTIEQHFYKSISARVNAPLAKPRMH